MKVSNLFEPLGDQHCYWFHMNSMCFESFKSVQTTSRPALQGMNSMCFEVFNPFESLIDYHYKVVSREFTVFFLKVSNLLETLEDQQCFVVSDEFIVSKVLNMFEAPLQGSFT